MSCRDDVIKWKHFPRYWPFVRGIHRSAVNSPNKGQWRGALMSSLIWAWTTAWVNNRESGDLRRHRSHFDVIVVLRFVMELLCYTYLTFLFTSTGRIFVHCFRGISRSASLVLAYLMIYKKIPLPEAVTLVRKKRAIHPNDGFLRQLCRMHNEIFCGEAEGEKDTDSATAT